MSGLIIGRRKNGAFELLLLEGLVNLLLRVFYFSTPKKLENENMEENDNFSKLSLNDDYVIRVKQKHWKQIRCREVFRK